MSRMLSLSRAAALALALALCILQSACSAKYLAQKVDPKEVRVSHPGIYYSLPKTELLVVVGVKKTTKKSGIYGGDVWDDCEKTCIKKKKAEPAKCELAEAKPNVSYELTSVKSYSRSIADPKHLYHVSLNTKAFVGFTHTFKISNEGILTSSSSEIENKGVEVAINSAKAALSLLAATQGALPAAPDKSSEAPGAAPPEPATCRDYRDDYAQQQKLDKKIQGWRDAMDAIVFSKSVPEGPAIEQMVKRHEARVSELKASAEYKVLIEHRAESSKEEVIGDFAVLIKPEEFTAAQAAETQWQAVQQIDTEGFAGLELKPAKQSEINGVVTELTKIKLRVAVTPRFGFGQENADLDESPTVAASEAAPATSAAAVDPGECSGDAAQGAPSAPVGTQLTGDDMTKVSKAKTGYRYRFPAAAEITVSRAFMKKEEQKDKDGTAIKDAKGEVITEKKCWREDIGKFRTLVAQYGAVTAMPPKITGVKSKIMLDLYESTGSPRQIDVGSTPVPSSVVGDALAPVQAEIERRNQEKKEKKEAAENVEQDALTKERDLLKLQKEIGELKKAIESGGTDKDEEPAAN